MSILFSLFSFLYILLSSVTLQFYFLWKIVAAMYGRKLDTFHLRSLSPFARQIKFLYVGIKAS